MTMKMKTMVVAAVVLVLGATSAFAQKGVEDGSQWGHGEDSIRCIKNIVMFEQYVKAGSMQDAYLPWKEAYTECPTAKVSIYTNGATILRTLISNEKDLAKREAYVEELMDVYDQRLRYLPELNRLIKGKKHTEGNILGTKAHDYINYAAKPDVNRAYDMFKRSIELEGDASQYYIVEDFMNISAQKYKADESHREQFITDYDVASALIKVILENATEKTQEPTANAKNNIEAYFINSGAASCENLQAMYGPRIEENKDDMEYLGKVVKLMRMFKCTDQEVYFQASEYAHRISPTAETAAGCAFMFYKKGDTERTLEFFDQAIELEEDPVQKSDYAYNAAVVLFSQKKYSQSKAYAYKAISFNGNNGRAYILIANLYASSPKWSEENALNSCTYFLCIDKLQKAKSVDPECAEDADKLIRTYSAHTPKAEDLFFLGLQKGNSVTIGGWIGETTTIR